MTYKPLLYGFALATLSIVPAPSQSTAPCAFFPADNVWNTPIDTLPVHTNSQAIVNTVGSAKALHPDFSNAGQYGIPFVVVPGTQATVPVTFTYADESDPGPYPIPANAPIEGGSSSTGDRHVLVLDNQNCVLYELFAAYPQANGAWKADSGAKFNLKSNGLRPAGWTSADAAGLPILPGLVRYDEVASGEIRHAIRMTAPQTLNAYVWPARHKASSLTGSQYPPMGSRFRLKGSFDITPYPADVQVILRALKKYGALLADNGSSWYLSGAPDSRWNDSTLHTLGQVLGSNFEVLDESSLMVDPNSGAVSTTLALSEVRLNPAQIGGGASSTQNQVVLSAPAPSGGAVVALQSSNPATASVPASATVSGGSNSASFQVSTTPVSAATAVTISAVYLGATKSATLTVAPPALTAVTLSPASVTGGTATTGSVQLNGPAPSGGITVTLSSSDTIAATTPANVTVPTGAASASFTVSTQAVTAARTAKINAVYGGVTCTASLIVNPPGTYTLQAPSTGNRRQTVTVNWTAPAGHSGADSVALYNPDGSLFWSHTTGTATSGSFGVRLPNRTGQCRFRYMRSGETAPAAESVITVR